MSEYLFGTAIISGALLLSVLGLWFTAVIPGIDPWSKRFFRWYFSAFVLSCVSGLADVAMVLNAASGVAAYYYVELAECLFLSVPLLKLTVYLVHCSGEALRESKLLRAALGVWLLYCAVLVSSLFLDGYTVITEDFQYYRGPLYPIVVLPMIALMLLNLAGTLRRRKRLSRKVFRGFLAATLPMCVGSAVHLFVDVFGFLDVCFIGSALIMYGFVLSDQIERDLARQRELVRQQTEIANQRASIMVLQMRPHFIYNTMTSIYALCNQDPQRARQVIMDFTAYLRKNFTAVASETPIPVTSELEHARAYLAVEQALYEDGLFVEFDTPHTWFRVPPLTLQPLVENSVKHGRDPFAGPFHISVRTRKTETGSEIVVADDGRGFANADDSEQGLALNNIRARLETMCGGSLTIAPNDGGGTVVTLTVPDAAPQ